MTATSKRKRPRPAEDGDDDASNVAPVAGSLRSTPSVGRKRRRRRSDDGADSGAEVDEKYENVAAGRPVDATIVTAPPAAASEAPTLPTGYAGGVEAVDATARAEGIPTEISPTEASGSFVAGEAGAVKTTSPLPQCQPEALVENPNKVLENGTTTTSNFPSLPLPAAGSTDRPGNLPSPRGLTTNGHGNASAGAAAAFRDRVRSATASPAANQNISNAHVAASSPSNDSTEDTEGTALPSDPEHVGRRDATTEEDRPVSADDELDADSSPLCSGTPRASQMSRVCRFLTATALLLVVLASLSFCHFSVLTAHHRNHHLQLLEMEAAEEARRREASARLNEALKKLGAASASLDSERRKNARLTSSEAGTRSSLEEANGRSAALEDDVASLTLRLGEARTEIGSLRVRVEELNKTERYLSEELNAARDRIDSLQGTERDAVEALEAAWARIDQITAQKHDVAVKLRETERTVASLEETRAGLTSQLEDARARNEELEGRERDVLDRLRKEERRVKLLSSERRDASTRLFESSVRISDLESNLAGFDGALVASLLQIDTLREEREENSVIVSELDGLAYTLISEIEGLHVRMEEQYLEAVAAVDAVATAAAYRREDSLQSLYEEMNAKLNRLASDAAAAVNAVSDAANWKKVADVAAKEREVMGEVARAIDDVVTGQETNQVARQGSTEEVWGVPSKLRSMIAGGIAEGTARMLGVLTGTAGGEVNTYGKGKQPYVLV